MVVHFFQDITHYDGKFVGSIRYLLTKPGFLTTEYMAGRRASYLQPDQDVCFTSAIFFHHFLFDQRIGKYQIRIHLFREN